MRQQHLNVGELLRRECFSNHYGPEFSAESLQQTVNFQGDRILFILDGLDEVHYALDAQSDMNSVLEALLTQRNVIITSRPHTIRRQFAAKLDLELEAIGLLSEQVEEYLKGQQMSRNTLTHIQAFITRNPLVQTLVRIPIQLDAICYAWSAKPFEDGNVTMSSLYWTILGRLCEKDIPLLSKNDADGEQIMQEQLQGHSTSELVYLVSDEIGVLGRLAFDGLNSEIVEFDIDRMTRANSSQLRLPDNTLRCTSFLRASFNSIDPSNRTYHFLHLTSQEFLAARYFVDQ